MAARTIRPKVWLRRLSDQLEERLLIVPLVFVAIGLVLSQLTLAVDRDLGDDTLPRILETTVDSANSILSTIAGGLISAITLLLSLVLVSVQLASSQFSPRTVRDWIGDRTQQRTIGVVLGTTVFCLMVLREAQTVDDSFELAPHLSVLVAVALAVISLVAVVRSVDHLSNSMRVGNVARSLAKETLDALRSLDGDLPVGSPPSPPVVPHRNRPPLTSGAVLTSHESGWIQRVDIDELAAGLPDNAHVSLVVGPGAFVFKEQPLAWVDVDGDVPTGLCQDVYDIGDTRLIGQDVSYGLLQMSDIALRALSPGVNDPNTAADVIVHMGVVLLEAWSQPVAESRLQIDGTTIDVIVTTHADYLDTALSQILRYATNEFEVLSTIRRTLQTIIAEAERRDLPGPSEPLLEMLRAVEHIVEDSALTSRDKQLLRA